MAHRPTTNFYNRTTRPVANIDLQPDITNHSFEIHSSDQATAGPSRFWSPGETISLVQFLQTPPSFTPRAYNMQHGTPSGPPVAGNSVNEVQSSVSLKQVVES